VVHQGKQGGEGALSDRTIGIDHDITELSFSRVKGGWTIAVSRIMRRADCPNAARQLGGWDSEMRVLALYALLRSDRMILLGRAAYSAKIVKQHAGQQHVELDRT